MTKQDRIKQLERSVKRALDALETAADALNEGLDCQRVVAARLWVGIAIGNIEGLEIE